MDTVCSEENVFGTDINQPCVQYSVSLFGLMEDDSEEGSTRVLIETRDLSMKPPLEDLSIEMLDAFEDKLVFGYTTSENNDRCHIGYFGVSCDGTEGQSHNDTVQLSGLNRETTYSCSGYLQYSKTENGATEWSIASPEVDVETEGIDTMENAEGGGIMVICGSQMTLHLALVDSSGKEVDRVSPINCD